MTASNPVGYSDARPDAYTDPGDFVHIPDPELILPDDDAARYENGGKFPDEEDDESFEARAARVERMTTLDRIMEVQRGWGFVPTDKGEASDILLIDKEPTTNKPAQYLNHVFLHQSESEIHTDKPEAAPRAIMQEWLKWKQEATTNPVFIRELEESIARRSDYGDMSAQDLLAQLAAGVPREYFNRALSPLKKVAVFSWLSIQDQVPKDVQRSPFSYVEKIWNDKLLPSMNGKQLLSHVRSTDTSNSLRKKYWDMTVEQGRYHETVQAVVARVVPQRVA